MDTRARANLPVRQQAVDEMDYLVIFNRSITQAIARTMQDLSEGILFNIANLTLARRDSYPGHSKDNAGLIRRYIVQYCQSDISPQGQLPGLSQSWNKTRYPHCLLACQGRGGDLVQ